VSKRKGSGIKVIRFDKELKRYISGPRQSLCIQLREMSFRGINSEAPCYLCRANGVCTEVGSSKREHALNYMHFSLQV
jgi:hypothetical protein